MGAGADPADLTLAEHRGRAGPAVDAAIAAATGHPYLVRTVDQVRDLAGATPDELRSVVIVLMDRASQGASVLDRVRGIVGGRPAGWIASMVLTSLGNRRPPFTRADVGLLLRLAAEMTRRHRGHEEWLQVSLFSQPVVAAERAVRAGGLGELEPPIRELADALEGFTQHSGAQVAKYRARLAALLQAGGSDDGARPVAIDPTMIADGDTWGVTWRERVTTLSADEAALVAHLPLATGVTPSAAWRRRAGELAGQPGSGTLLRAMLDDATTSKTTLEPRRYEFGDQVFVVAAPAICDANVLLLRGAMWAAASLDEPWVPDLLTAIGIHFGTSGSSSNVARDERLANTAAAALGSMTAPSAIAGIGRMKAKVTNRNVSRQVGKALAAAAGRAGITPSELLEAAVPTLDLDVDGRRAIAVADHAAVLALEGDEATLAWRAPDGRMTARPPSAVAAEKAAIATAKDELRELRAALAVERGRIEELFVEDRSWAIDDWRARYLEHPLTGSIGRRLIWAFTGGDRAVTAISDGGELLTADGGHVQPGPDATVRLWHPIVASEAEIAAWRTLIVERRIRQPFKQAFREVYRLTPAEEQTEAYSNRFAAHVLRYPQARALMTARRWGSNFLGPYDGGFNGVAKRVFPTHGLRAEFWHDAVEAEIGAEVVHCTTDQVRFVRPGPPEATVPLRDVPSIVLSEAMRDVDLFVSVTSVGADRNWQDGGRDRGHVFDGYWTGYWDQPLTATANVRRDVLERMIPGLAIADRLEVRDRWLVVRGDLRTYRIHLGSGNILMEPSDTYLCIVPTRGGSAERLFLPFDDDPTLSIILSKAFLLAADNRITDRTILGQIGRP